MSGFVKLYRGWQNSDMFDNAAAYCERAAWLWLITNAAWKETTRRNGKGETVSIERGQIHVSLSALASTWGWSIKRVRTFLKMLEKGHAVGTIKGTSGTIITICNYDKYQDKPEQSGTTGGTGRGTIGAQSGHTQEEGKERKEEKNNEGYAFCGSVIRLTKPDFDRWQQSFANLDLMAELQSRDDYLKTQGGDAKKNWFVPTSNHFRNLNAKARQQERAGNAPTIPTC